MSPLLPRLDKNESKNSDEKTENFKSDLLNYISSYNLSQLEKIKEEIENFDFSQVKIRLVASIPGKGTFMLHFPRITTWYRPRCRACRAWQDTNGITGWPWKNLLIGRHKGDEKFKWGHFKFRKLFKELKFDSSNSDNFIGQFSSIGSVTESWIKEFMQSFATSNEKTSDYDSKV